jgi:Glycosyl hydrolase family 81 C-terminal domain
MEIQSVKKYWHMMTNSTIYDSLFASNTMVGNVGALGVTASTWFGDNPEYVHGINIIPVTPATSLLLDQSFVELEWLELGYFLPNSIAEKLTTPSCSSNSGCAGLLGDCCPTSSGVWLGCCPTNIEATYAEWLGFMYVCLFSNNLQ